MPTQNKKNHKDIVRFLTELEAFASIHAFDGNRLVFDPSEMFKFPIPIYTGKIDTTVSFPTLLKLYNERNRVVNGDCEAKKYVNK